MLLATHRGRQALGNASAVSTLPENAEISASVRLERDPSSIG